MILWRICDIRVGESSQSDSIIGVIASRPTSHFLAGFIRMKHAIDQHPQAAIEFRFPERLSEHRRISIPPAKFSIPSGDKGEWDALGTEPLGYRICCFAIL